jgi:hypothetical protein
MRTAASVPPPVFFGQTLKQALHMLFHPWGVGFDGSLDVDFFTFHS